MEFQKLMDSCIDPNKKAIITIEKLQKHKELMVLINREDKLMNDLDDAR